jgi:type IV pilus assembly protein PilB
MSQRVFESIPDTYALRAIPKALASEHGWLAYQCHQHSRTVKVLVATQPGIMLKQNAKRLLQEQYPGWDFTWHECSVKEKLTKAIQRAYQTSYDVDEIGRAYAVSDSAAPVLVDDDQRPVAVWLDALLNDAVHRRASDIHLMRVGASVTVHFRVDGGLSLRTQLPIQYWQAVVARIKSLAKLDVTEHRLPQDGRFDVTVRAQQQPIRVAIMPHGRFEKLTLRLLPAVSDIPSWKELAVLAGQRQQLVNAVEAKQGVIVVAGSTGSGKTTTAYRCLLTWLQQGLQLISLEDPIEVSLPGVCQSAVNHGLGYGFAEGLRAALRHDPDGLMVGEVRDNETCSLLVRAALTGHPVIASVHAQDAVSVFQRLLGLGATLHDLQATISLIVMQRLAKKPCHCINANYKTLDCDVCSGTGYLGRVAVMQLFKPTAEFYRCMSGWGIEQQRQKAQGNETLNALLNKQFIDLPEHRRLSGYFGGTDAQVSSQSR